MHSYRFCALLLNNLAHTLSDHSNIGRWQFGTNSTLSGGRNAEYIYDDEAMFGKFGESQGTLSAGRYFSSADWYEDQFQAFDSFNIFMFRLDHSQCSPHTRNQCLDGQTIYMDLRGFASELYVVMCTQFMEMEEKRRTLCPPTIVWMQWYQLHGTFREGNWL